jgi:hypothetical protein
MILNRIFKAGMIGFGFPQPRTKNWANYRDAAANINVSLQISGNDASGLER